MNNKGKHEVLIGIIIGLGSAFLFTVVTCFLILLFMVKADDKKKKEAKTTEEVTTEYSDDDGGDDEGGGETASGNFPAAGTYLFKGYGDEDSNGEYAENLNIAEIEFTNDQGFETYDQLNEFDNMVDNAKARAITFNDDGTGTYSDWAKTSDVSFKDDYFKINNLSCRYGFDEDTFWYEDGSERKVMIYEKTTDEVVQRIRDGLGMSVPIEDAKVGDMITLGTYEQNHNNSDGKEAIVWDVLAIEDGKMLVISDKVLDSYCFNNTDGQPQPAGLSWENCTLREFLNGDFIDTCFTDDERAMIQTTHLTNPSSKDYLADYWGGLDAPYDVLGPQNHEDGPETDDRVFVLSVEEVLKYMGEEDDYRPDDEYPFSRFVGASGRTARITSSIRYAGNVYYEHTTCEACWITRTLSDPDEGVVYLTSNGSFFNWYSNSVGLGLRPAMWIEIP